MSRWPTALLTPCALLLQRLRKALPKCSIEYGD
jgi:hypothetical protein